MTISYNWLCEYLPPVAQGKGTIEPERLSKILTSIGLEVESMEKFESVKGGLLGLVTGQVLSVEQHPNADKLKITTVNIGQDAPLSIVCGAANVAVNQKVIVAPVGTTIYPTEGDPLTMKVAKIRGVESFGMICAEDEIGLGTSHEGILVLPEETPVGQPAAEIFKPYTDVIFEIGLTPNRMDAMSHLGVARDVCAYLTHHEKKDFKPKAPFTNGFKPDQAHPPTKVVIENKEACERYAGVSLTGVQVGPSPDWLKNRLKAIGLRPINNIVDATNYILHETGQPLHAFDAKKIEGNTIVVKCLPDQTSFTTLDEKERKLHSEDLMICDAKGPLCLAGVFGGIESGVTDQTTDIFLESAWFHPSYIRKTSVRHQLRTDAAVRFEKGVDISQTVQVLKRAALLIKEIAGGEISSEVIDVYPQPREKVQVSLKHHYLKKLSGKNYHPDTIRKILNALGFEFLKEGMDDTWWAVPYSKPDISLPADIVEEIMRIDGLDNVEIPELITIAPAVEKLGKASRYQERISDVLNGFGCSEIFTNSITNSAYFEEETLQNSVKMLNNLSAELDIMRPSIIETGLESIAFNLNRKQKSIRFFEFGKTYHRLGKGQFQEKSHLALFVTGNKTEASWRQKENETDFFHIKSITEAILKIAGVSTVQYEAEPHRILHPAFSIKSGQKTLGQIGSIAPKTMQRFGIKSTVWVADLSWDDILQYSENTNSRFKELPKQLPVERDLALVLPKQTGYEKVEKVVAGLKIQKLKKMNLFDVFESEKLGMDKKSMAINLQFLDEEKTMTDKEIDTLMNKIMQGLEKELNAEIRKA